MSMFHRMRLPGSSKLTMICMLLAACALSVNAQDASSTHVLHSSVNYDKAHEITITGNVQKVAFERVSGSPFGVHLFVAASEGLVDVHLGTYLDKPTQDSLHAGTPVRLVGAVETIHDKSFLLARQLIFGGRAITIRNENGFLVGTPVGHGRRATSSNKTDINSNSAKNGGAQ